MSIHVNCIERRMPADVEAVPYRTTEADIGDLFRDRNFTDEVAE